MAAGKEKSKDFYAVLGLKKECSNSELRNAYKKLALRSHPDRCSASRDTKFVEESKKKFQAIQEAYSVLSDENKRFLYDVGVYDSDDDENGMGDFYREMAMMMSQTKGKGEESFEELQELFQEMFQCEISGFGSSSQTHCQVYPSTSDASAGNNKRNFSDISPSPKTAADSGLGFCFGAANKKEDKETGRRPRTGGKRRNGRKQEVSLNQDVSSQDAGISA